MKLYVLISNTLSVAYQGVQGGHALAQWLLDHPGQTWNNQTLVYLSCSNLLEWADRLKHEGLPVSLFHEPDLDGALTALAVQSEGKLFKRLRLIGS